MNLFGHRPTPPLPTGSPTLFRVRQTMSKILRIPMDSVHPNDSFASLTHTEDENDKDGGLDNDFLDLCALEVALKDEFQLDVSEEESEKLFAPKTTAQMFAHFIDEKRHH